jgi:membrane carboxypeptidase/penicillin-binding protein
MYSTAVWVGHPTSREYTGYGGPTAGPVWQNFMSSAQGGECPEFEVPDELPELSAGTGEHTTSSSDRFSEDEEGEYEESEEEEGEEGEAEAEEEGEEATEGASETGVGGLSPG